MLEAVRREPRFRGAELPRGAVTLAEGGGEDIDAAIRKYGLSSAKASSRERLMSEPAELFGVVQLYSKAIVKQYDLSIKNVQATKSNMKVPLNY